MAQATLDGISVAASAQATPVAVAAGVVGSRTFVVRRRKPSRQSTSRR